MLHECRTTLTAPIGLIVTLTVAIAGQSSPAAQSCVVVYDGGAVKRIVGTATECATRLSPASTYKVPHALIGLETGVVTATTVEKWNGVKHAAQPKWNQDHTVLSAMKPSVLWFFQAMAPKIGAARAQDFLKRFGYGNADTGGDVTQYWVNGTLRISPDEQLAFLRRFYEGTLPVSRMHVDRVTTAMEQAAGTVENARGVHQLATAWRAGDALNSKTGATTTASGESVSWLIGQLTTRGRRVVFASAVWRPSGGVDSLDATRLAVTAFQGEALLMPRAAP